MSIWEEISNMPVNMTFVRLANGFRYICKLVDKNKPPAKVQKEYNGQPSGLKWQVVVNLLRINVQFKSDIETMQRDEKDAFDKITAQTLKAKTEPGHQYILELPKGGLKNLGVFLTEHPDTDRFAMYRTGKSNKTVYHFEEVTEKDLE